MDSTGVVTAVAKGSAKITVRGNESVGVKSTSNITVVVPLTGISGIQENAIIVKGSESSTVKVTCNVTVKVPLDEIRGVQANKIIIKGNTAEISAIKFPTDSTEILLYESSDTNIATVNDEGLITAIAGGSATITVKGNESSEVVATCNVTVKVPLTEISGVQANETITKGNRVQLEAEKIPSDTTESLVYESSNTNVATVDNTGFIETITDGITIITVKGSESSNVKAICTVTVGQAGIILINQDRTLLGETTGYSNKNPVIPQGFRPLETTSASWTYTDDTNTEVTGWNKGLVITDDSQGREGYGNEFVWIPVEDISSYTRSRYCKQMTSGMDTTTNSLKIYGTISSNSYYREAMPSDEEASVSAYKGYYIGRYEAGDATKPIGPESTYRTSSSGTSSPAVVKKDMLHMII